MTKAGEVKNTQRVSQTNLSTQRLSDSCQPDIINCQQTPPPPAYSKVNNNQPHWKVHNPNRAILTHNEKSLSTSLNAHSLSSFAVPANYTSQTRHTNHVQYQPVYHNSSKSEPGGHFT